MLMTVAAPLLGRLILLSESLDSIAAQDYIDCNTALAYCPRWSAIKLAFKLLSPYNNYFSPDH